MSMFSETIKASEELAGNIIELCVAQLIPLVKKYPDARLSVVVEAALTAALKNMPQKGVFELISMLVSLGKGEELDKFQAELVEAAKERFNQQPAQPKPKKPASFDEFLSGCAADCAHGDDEG